MSLHPHAVDPIPEATARIARAAFRRGSPVMRMRDEIGALCAGHLASWAGLCPGVHESAGKRKSGKRREGNKAVRRALTEAAHAAARTKKPGRTYLRGQYRRLVIRGGKKMDLSS